MYEDRFPRLGLFIFLSLVPHVICMAWLMNLPLGVMKATSLLNVEFLTSPAQKKPRPVTHLKAPIETRKSTRAGPTSVNATEAVQAEPQVAPTLSVTKTVSSYLEEIVSMINQQKRYPPSSQRRGQQGKVVLQLKIDRAGSLLAVEVRDPSPFADLNLAAIETIRRIERYPPLPAEFKAPEILLKVPVEYRLE